MVKTPSRIMHVITDFAKLAGAEKSLINLIDTGLSEEALIVSLKSCALADEGATKAGNYACVGLDVKGFNLIAAERGLARSYRNFRPDAVISWMYHANLVSGLFKLRRRPTVPVIWTVHHSLEDFRTESLSTKLAILGSSLLSRAPDAITYVSERARDQHRAIFRSKRPSQIIPNVIPIPKEFKRSEGEPGVVVGFAARYHPIKDFPSFIRAAKTVTDIHPHVRFVACGRDVTAENRDLLKIIEAEGLSLARIDLLGHVENMEAFYRTLDLFLLTSRSEGFGMVLVEAMAAGVPCIATDVGAAREIIGDTGAVVGVGDVQALAGGILEFAAAPPPLRAVLRQRARARIQNLFAPEAVQAAYREIIRQSPVAE